MIKHQGPILFLLLLLITGCDKLIQLEPSIYANCCGIAAVEDTVGSIRFAIPNLITPNRDGTNERFVVISDQDLLVKSLDILAKTGSLGITRSNFHLSTFEGWFPQNSSNIVYHGLFDYTITVSDMKGHEKTVTGQFCSLECDVPDEDIETIMDCRLQTQHDGGGAFDPTILPRDSCFGL